LSLSLIIYAMLSDVSSHYLYLYLGQITYDSTRG